MIDVVICGNIRTELSFFEICREVVAAKRRGLVRQIVFATWRSELPRFPLLGDVLQRLGIDVVTLDPPTPYSGSLPIQHLQFWRGLQALDDRDGWVLKTRTDKAFPQTASLFDALATGRLALDQLSEPSTIFSRRIIVDGAAITEAFPHNDLTLLVDKRDARRLLNIDAAFDYIFADHGYYGQEARWFVTPVMSHHPSLKVLCEQVNLCDVALAIETAAQQGHLSDAPEAVFRYLGSYWSILHDHVALVDRYQHGELPALSDVLSGAVQRPWGKCWPPRVLATNQLWLDHLAKGDPGNDRLLARCAAFRTEPTAYDTAVQLIDHEALNAFSAANGVASPQPQRRSWITRSDAVETADMPALFTSLLRTVPDPSTTRSIYLELDGVMDRDRAAGGSQQAFLEEGSRLDREAREQNDRGKAEIAFLYLISAAWARLPEAMDRVCGLVHDGFVDGDQRRHEAFDSVYYFYAQQPTNAAARYWYGIQHIARQAPDQVEFGMKCIREAAGLGDPRAIKYLERTT